MRLCCYFFFVWVFISIFNFDVQGVWLGIATAVSSGWILSFVIANKVAKKEIGGLLRASD